MSSNDLMDMVVNEVSYSVNFYLVFENFLCIKDHKFSNRKGSDGREFEWQLQEQTNKQTLFKKHHTEFEWEQIYCAKILT